ncbi:MAG TPA: L-aspartate oxidase [Planctomycetaceae bacterium]|nr:L-aspartate oxidase [Planctomycetaceae bacterium]
MNADFQPPIQLSGPSAPRYLVAFGTKRIAHYFTDVLIIGGGLAGLRAALAIDKSLETVVVSKGPLQESNSSYAQGGIASVWDPEDRFEDHVSDTLTAGANFCDPAVVEMVVREAPGHINQLIQWGTQFDNHQGQLMLGQEGGHSRQRILHALGDATGKEIMRAVIQRTRQSPNINICEQAFTIDLLTDHQRCCGAIIARAVSPPLLLWARETILCTGGCGQVYRETTNPRVATGDGHALAYRAGARLRDMEFMQFHPTVLYIAGSSRTLVTEAIRGAGAHLVDCNQYRFMPDYDSRLELAPRDVVSQSIVSQMGKTQHPCVYLSLKHLSAEKVHSEFPGFTAACKKFGLEPSIDLIPVRPGAHYMIGGVEVDCEGRSSLKGLWAAGEVTSSGLHGANRLASNSLLEGLVYGARAGQAGSGQLIAAPDSRPLQLPKISSNRPSNANQLDVADIRNSVQSLMWRWVGVQRSDKKLAEALDELRTYSRYVLPHVFEHEQGWELQNLLTTALLMAEAAWERKESRGVHLRIDFPELSQQWHRHLYFQRADA